MNASSFQCALAKLTVVLCAISGGWGASAEPFVPTHGHEVLERVRARPFDPAASESRELRAQLAANPTDAALAIKAARHCIGRSRAEGDPRYLGHAQSALAPWWNQSGPPVEILVLRATIKQSRHQFADALADLDVAIRTAPAHAQAWLTRATILTVLGRYEEARACALPLARAAPELLALTAAANVACLTGQAERACLTLQQQLDRPSRTNVAERLWALTLLAETEARLGKTVLAETHFCQALALDARDHYLLGAFADFLLDQGRAREVIDLLMDYTQVDSLLLRLALAESALTPPPSALSSHIEALRARFAANQLRGIRVHQREEGRFELHLLKRPDRALALAMENWEVQREPADVRLLLEAALAADNSTAALPALDFIQRNRLEDAAVRHLAERVRLRDAPAVPQQLTNRQ